MTTIQIRQYEPSDLDPCRALWVELTQHHRIIYDDPTIGGDNPGQYFDQHLARVGAERLWVAECDGQVVGLAGLLPSGRAENEVEVEPLVIAQAYRGQGVGRALLERVIEEARDKLGLRYLSVKPVARNQEAIQFYYEMGFCALGEIEMFIELQPAPPGTWDAEVDLFGQTFKY
jgi:GNAT superfamily N-acetyltransferase